jgi:signal transduction histidine kinase
MILGRDLDVEIADDLPTVVAERVRLLEVMLDLIDNAVQLRR